MCYDVYMIKIAEFHKIKTIFSLAILAMIAIACSGDDETTNEISSQDLLAANKLKSKL